MKKEYVSYLKEVSEFIPKDRIYTDELRLLAWGTDAGFYRMIPQVVIRSSSEEEVSRLMALAHKYSLPVTFRAAGTSLSGQSISDSVLIVAGKNWEKYTISPDAKTITMQPGLIGERVNQILKPLGRKFAPDPASVKSAMVGGIGIAPGANINYDSGYAIFEATHGSAPNIAGKNVVNPCSLLLSSVMMLEYMGWNEAGRLITAALEHAFSEGKATRDLARFMPNGQPLGTKEFGEYIMSVL